MEKQKNKKIILSKNENLFKNKKTDAEIYQMVVFIFGWCGNF